MSANEPTAVVRQVASIDLCGYTAELGESELATLADVCGWAEDDAEDMEHLADLILSEEIEVGEGIDKLDLIKTIWGIRRDFLRLASIKVEKRWP
ncbi:MAG: hypothetical protein K6B45_04645 [Bacteroidaceae bacterium]|nr:hypothetical protein [Bacteroidaceae bacterium]